jgi:hypothetical protein
MANENVINSAHRKCILDAEREYIKSNPGWRKICVRIPESDGWDTEAEWLWAKRVTDDSYELCNIPIYAYGLSLGDVVRVINAEDGALEFADVVQRGGHSTYRIIASEGLDQQGVQELLTALRERGCDTEQVNRVHLTIDVPPSADIFDVYDLLQKAEASGFCKFEEGHCGHPTDKTE